MLAKNTIGMSAFFMINKKITLQYGLEAALFLAVLADAEMIFSDDDENAGFVFQTVPTVEAMSCGFLTKRKQAVAIQSLIEGGIIEQKNMGLPLRRYFRINNSVLMKVLTSE